METTEIEVNFTRSYDAWPLTCIHCEGIDLTISSQVDDVICNDCGRWQLNQEVTDE